MNWPSNVRHPMLDRYMRHVFQDTIVGNIGIRSSTQGIWVNVTLLNNEAKAIDQHPLVKEPWIDMRNASVSQAKGRTEQRIHNRATSHSFYKPMFADLSHKSLLEKLELDSTHKQHSLGIYRDCAIHLRINIIRNPMLDASILAQHVSRQLKANKSLASVFRGLQTKLG